VSKSTNSSPVKVHNRESLKAKSEQKTNSSKGMLSNSMSEVVRESSLGENRGVMTTEDQLKDINMA